MTANHPHEDDTAVFDLDAARRAREGRANEPVSLHKPDSDDDPAPSPTTVEGEVLARVDVRSNRRVAPRRAVLPAWAKDPAAAKATASWALAYSAHATAFHTVRLPLYWGRLAMRSPLGLGRLIACTWRWVFDTENKEVRRELLSGGIDHAGYLRLKEHQKGQVRARGLVAALGTLGTAGAGIVVTGLPLVDELLIAAAGLAGLGALGRDRSKTITGRAVDTAKVPPLTADLIVNALSSLGLAGLNQAVSRSGSSAIAFPSPITRDGAGFRADIDLPPGVTAGEVIERRDRLASGLRRPLGQVWPEADQDVHSGRLVLYVADKSLSESKPVAWPLAKAGKVNVFEPIPIGVDQRGRAVTVELMFASGIVGAIPRMGKTFLLRLLCLAAALDPRVQMYVFNLKGGSDLDPLEGVAHAYRSGDDPEDMDILLGSLRAAQKEMRRRYSVLRTLPKEVCPESKVTDALASRRDLGLWPMFLAFDETQIMFEHSVYGAELAEIVTDLVKRGPAVGIMVWLATQRPDAKSIPTGISANAVLRLCLKVMGQVENDMVLGTSAYKSGTRATMFGRKDRGIAYLVGEGDDPVIVRSAYVDTPAAEAIGARARAVRADLGLLTGQAAGEEDPDVDTGSVLDHLLSVWPTEDPDWPNGKVWCEELAARLAAAKPSLYQGWTGEQITAAVKPHGIRPVQVKHTSEGHTANRRGLRRSDVTDALGITDPDDPDDGLGPVGSPLPTPGR